MKDFECEAISRVAQDPNFSIAEVREGVATYLDNILVAYEKQPGGRKADASSADDDRRAVAVRSKMVRERPRSIGQLTVL